MARKRGFAIAVELPSEDTRPVGALRFADPSTAEFPRHIHEFNDPPSKNLPGGEHSRGVRSMTGDLVPWGDRHTTGLWVEMNRKRGVVDPDGDEHG